jgi:hypothetical protein
MKYNVNIMPLEAIQFVCFMSYYQHDSPVNYRGESDACVLKFVALCLGKFANFFIFIFLYLYFFNRIRKNNL